MASSDLSDCWPLVRSGLTPAAVDKSTSHLRDEGIPSPSDVWCCPPIGRPRNKPCPTELRLFNAMARRLQSRLRQSSIYAVSLANSDRKESGCTYHLHFCGSMRGELFLSSGPPNTPPLRCHLRERSDDSGCSRRPCLFGACPSRGPGRSDGGVAL